MFVKAVLFHVVYKGKLRSDSDVVMGKVIPTVVASNNSSPNLDPQQNLGVQQNPSLLSMAGNSDRHSKGKGHSVDTGESQTP